MIRSENVYYDMDNMVDINNGKMNTDPSNKLNIYTKLPQSERNTMERNIVKKHKSKLMNIIKRHMI